MKEGLKKISQKQITILIWIILIVLIVGAMCVVINKNTPKQKAIGISNKVIKSLKTHNGKDSGLIDVVLINKKYDMNGPFIGLSIFDYKLKSVSERNVKETYIAYNVRDSDSEFASTIKIFENGFLKIQKEGQWIENKESDSKVTFTSQKYKVKQYYLTYNISYSTDGGSKKERDITVITQEQKHDNNDFKVMDIQGIN